MKRFLFFLVSFLLLVLGSCQPLDPNLNRLPGTWERVYPEDDPLNLYETWTFGNDGKLFIHSEGPSATFDIPYQYSVNSDGEEPILKTNHLMADPSLSVEDIVTEFIVKSCNKTTLVLHPILSNYIYGFTLSDITFYRVD